MKLFKFENKISHVTSAHCISYGIWSFLLTYMMAYNPLKLLHQWPNRSSFMKVLTCAIKKIFSYGPFGCGIIDGIWVNFGNFAWLLKIGWKMRNFPQITNRCSVVIKLYYVLIQSLKSLTYGFYNVIWVNFGNSNWCLEIAWNLHKWPNKSSFMKKTFLATEIMPWMRFAKFHPWLLVGCGVLQMIFGWILITLHELSKSLGILHKWQNRSSFMKKYFWPHKTHFRKPLFPVVYSYGIWGQFW